MRFRDPRAALAQALFSFTPGEKSHLCTNGDYRCFQELIPRGSRVDGEKPDQRGKGAADGGDYEITPS